METDAQLPRPIDDGRVAQAIVEYTGRRDGAATYRGPSGREYCFDAGPSDRVKYVLREDLERFRSLRDFRVLEDTLIDPEADRMNRLESGLAALRADAERREARLADTASGGPLSRNEGQRGRPKRKRGGRPRVPRPELQRLWHLKHHSLPPWSIESLANEFLEDAYATPHATISTRLSRFKRDHPELLDEDRCPSCARGDDPDPAAPQQPA